MFATPATNFLCLRPFHQIIRYAKFGPKNREERLAVVHANRRKIIEDSLFSVLKKRKNLSVQEWKALQTELEIKEPTFKSSKVLKSAIFNVLMSLRPPNDSMANAKTLFEAFGLTNDIGLKQNYIQLYAKRAAEQQLTDEEEKELIEL